jgi:hypothetical protein
LGFTDAEAKDFLSEMQPNYNADKRAKAGMGLFVLRKRKVSVPTTNRGAKEERPEEASPEY